MTKHYSYTLRKSPMIIDYTRKQECMQEIKAKLPIYLIASNIVLTPDSQKELEEIINESIRSTYFPNILEELFFAVGQIGAMLFFFPIWVIYMLAESLGTNGVKINIPDSCENPELQNLAAYQLDSLGKLLDALMVNYRDHVQEAAYEKQLQEQEEQLEMQRIESESTEREKKARQEAAALRDENKRLKSTLKSQQQLPTPTAIKQENIKPEEHVQTLSFARFMTLANIAFDHDQNPMHTPRPYM